MKLAVDIVRAFKRDTRHFFYYLINYVVAYVPSYTIRHACYRLIGIKLGEKASIKMGAYIEGPNIQIGANSSVGRNSVLDGRSKLVIGDNVAISPNVKLLTMGHDIESSRFASIGAKTEICDYVWIGTGAIVLPGVTICKNAVVAAGSVVTKDVAENIVVAGVPAREIKRRRTQPIFYASWAPLFN